MTRAITTQAVSLTLALLVTVATLIGLNGLAAAEHAAQQQAAAATSTRA